MIKQSKVKPKKFEILSFLFGFLNRYMDKNIKKAITYNQIC